MQSKTKSKRRLRCRYNLSYLNTKNLGKIAVGFLLLTLIITASGQDETEEAEIPAEEENNADNNKQEPPEGTNGDKTDMDTTFRSDGHGTIHEKLGQAHYPNVELTGYQSKAIYTVEKNYTTWPIHPAYNFTHFIFDTVIRGKPALPPGYLVVKNESTLALGPKVEQNDWSALLAEYFLVILWILLLLILIILVPFLAVCYCCFCCCRRCKIGCPPCDGPRDKRRNLICSSVLLFLIIILLLGLLMAFFATRILDRGFDDTTTTMKRGSKDTCTFLQDVSDHIYHVFVNNYQELEAHLTEILNEAANHIFLDLGDASESNAIAELERMLDNMKEARTLMKQVEEMEKELRFNAAQLRDGVRGIKRDVTYTCTILIANHECTHLLKTSALQFVDTSTCLHLDKLPDSSLYVEGMEKIMKDNVADIPKRALMRFKEIGDKIAVAMDTVLPPLRMDIGKGLDIFQAQASKVRSLIDRVISDIHWRTMHSTKSFEDIQDKYGTDRNLISMLACLLILLILVVLIAALIFGCFLNKGTGAHCLLLAIMLIFAVFSFILLISIFYFVIGLISYQGACAPLRDQGKNALFRQMDSEMDLNKFLPASGAEKDPQYSPMRMSSAIKACMENQSIFELLQTNKLYDTEDLMSIKIMPEGDEDESRSLVFEDDLSKVSLLTEAEGRTLHELRNGNLSGYHSIMYLENMCKQLTPNLPSLAAELRNLSNYIYTSDDTWNDYTRVGRVSLKNEAMQLYLYDKKYTGVILNLMDKMKAKLLRIDELIVYENRNFSNSVEVLVNAIIRSERFLRSQGNHFINSLGQNLTDVINEQIDTFIQRVIHECNTNIGRCSPLAYIYYRGVDLICYRLVDPLNAFWLGLLICALTMIPIFFVAHRLMCLWKRLHAYRVMTPERQEVIEGGCPTCTGAPYVPPPIITCTGGQQTFCVCSEGKLNRTDGGAAPSTTTVHVDSHEIADNDIDVVQATSIDILSVPAQSQEDESASGMQPNPPKKSKSKED
ncbi:prominin-like protein [Drosophila innubila]|uniref:prominin-like protein n=1 Tax=Drosophila innubila TaxID=198719 RepID=UPI00148B5E26|nr:prominin-like protein [Drosophila innubila]